MVGLTPAVQAGAVTKKNRLFGSLPLYLGVLWQFLQTILIGLDRMYALYDDGSSNQSLISWTIQVASFQE